MEADYEARGRLLDYLGIFGAVMVLSLLIALVISGWLQAVLTKPILDVAALTRQVVERRDFSLRVRKTTQDEIVHAITAGVATKVSGIPSTGGGPQA